MSKVMQFEHSLSELETIVKQLEQGDLTLDESLKQFEKGISLARSCQDLLQKAEQKIQMLTAINTESNEPGADSFED